MRPLVAMLAAMVLSAGGCAGGPLAVGRADLDRADRLAREGAWERAAAAYGDYALRYPHAEAAPRAEASRDTLNALLAARTEVARLRAEMSRLRDDLARRDGDLLRARQEADRLKSDLERLKEIDLKLERRR